jgi:hypothetical protein
MNALPANIEPAEPSESTKQALAMLDAMYEPKFADLRSRCALAAMRLRRWALWRFVLRWMLCRWR